MPLAERRNREGTSQKRGEGDGATAANEAPNGALPVVAGRVGPDEAPFWSEKDFEMKAHRAIGNESDAPNTQC